MTRHAIPFILFILAAAQARAFHTTALTTPRAAGTPPTLNGLAIFFNIARVYIVGLILALFSTLHQKLDSP